MARSNLVRLFTSISSLPIPKPAGSELAALQYASIRLVRAESSSSNIKRQQEEATKHNHEAAEKNNKNSQQEEEEEDDDDGDGGDDHVNKETGEIGGPRGPEPTRYGDWERNGRCYDF